MQHCDHGAAGAGAALGGFHQIDLIAQVEARCRLVQQKYAGAMFSLAARELHQDTREMRALLFAAGQRRQLAMAERFEL